MTHGSRNRRTVTIAMGAAFVVLGGLALPAVAGNLHFYEATVGPSLVRSIPGPTTNLLVDLDYSPASAEGGRVYGVSEVEIQTTGNLVLTPTGFACQATSCLYSPAPFVAGKRIRVTAGNDLTGDAAGSANFLTIGLTGSVGHVVLVRGAYLDGTGSLGSVGSVGSLDPAILVTVPEPDPVFGLVAAGTGLVLAGRRTERARRTDR